LTRSSKSEPNYNQIQIATQKSKALNKTINIQRKSNETERASYTIPARKRVYSIALRTCMKQISERNALLNISIMIKHAYVAERVCWKA